MPRVAAPQRLTVVKTYTVTVPSKNGNRSHTHATVTCVCDPEKGGCGRTLEARAYAVKIGKTKSCGCLKKEHQTSQKLPAFVKGPASPSTGKKAKAPEGPTIAEKFIAWVKAGRVVCCYDAPECLAEGKCRRMLA